MLGIFTLARLVLIIQSEPGTWAKILDDSTPDRLPEYNASCGSCVLRTESESNSFHEQQRSCMTKEMEARNEWSDGTRTRATRKPVSSAGKSPGIVRCVVHGICIAVSICGIGSSLRIKYSDTYKVGDVALYAIPVVSLPVLIW